MVESYIVILIIFFMTPFSSSQGDDGSSDKLELIILISFSFISTLLLTMKTFMVDEGRRTDSTKLMSKDMFAHVFIPWFMFIVP